MKKKEYIQPQTEVVCFQNVTTLVGTSPESTHGPNDPNNTDPDPAPPMTVFDEVPEIPED